MRLGYRDRAFQAGARFLLRDKGETRNDYTMRFFGEIRGLGNVDIVTLRGERVTIRATRKL